MNLEISVPEVVSLIKEIQGQPERLFEMIRVDMRQSVGRYLSEMMKAELTDFLGRERYKRVAGNKNHRNGSYDRGFTLKSIGEVAVEVPRDRKGKFKTQIIPRSKQYEDEIREALSEPVRASTSRTSSARAGARGSAASRPQKART